MYVPDVEGSASASIIPQTQQNGNQNLPKGEGAAEGDFAATTEYDAWSQNTENGKSGRLCSQRTLTLQTANIPAVEIESKVVPLQPGGKLGRVSAVHLILGKIGAYNGLLAVYKSGVYKRVQGALGKGGCHLRA